MEIKEMNCPNCGNPVFAEDKKCKYCGGPIVITNLVGASNLSVLQLNKYVASYRQTVTQQPDNARARISLGLCRLRLRFYGEALSDFKTAVESDFGNADLHFYCAVCLLCGKKPFLQTRSVIDEVITYLNAAISIAPKGVYYYFLAFVIADYFERKKFKTESSSREFLSKALKSGCSEMDKSLLFDILSVDRPSYM